MDPIEDCAFLWIAEQALVAPLPDDWSEHMDADGNVYYYNVVTDASSWEHPMDQYYRNLFLKVKKEHDDKRAKEEQQRLEEEAERAAAEEDAKRAEEERELARTRSALLIQRNYRGLQGRKAFRKRMEAVEENQKHRAATMLQAAWRGQFVRKYVAQYRDEIEAARREEAVVTIQARHRGRKGRRNATAHKKRHDARKRENAATMIQSHHRRKKCAQRTHGLRRERAATYIQSAHRGYGARQHTAKLRKHKKRKDAATKIQCNYRMSYQRKLYQRAKLFVEGITRIQALHRGRAQRKRYRAAVKAERENRQSWAATKIQARARGRRAREYSENLRHRKKQSQSARYIQAQWRYSKHKKRRHKAASKMQARHRGRAARKRHYENKRNIALQRIKERHASFVIQRRYREHRLRVLEQKRLEMLAATKLQCQWRGRKGRRVVIEVRERRYKEKAATTISSSFRGLMGRFKAKQKRLLKFSSSIASVVPQKINPRGDQQSKGRRKQTLDMDEVESDLKVKAVWLVVDTEDADTETAHYFFLRGKPLAALQYLEKSLNASKGAGARLSLVAAFTNYATLMSKIGQHAHAQRLVVYALRLLNHYVSVDGKLITGFQQNEKISLDGADGHQDARFVSIRSTAAVVLHNVAVEMLLLAEVPHFGDSVSRAGEALIAAQNSLGPHHPWRQRIENTHHVIIQLCKKGHKLDLKTPLKVQIKPLKHDTSGRPRKSKGKEVKGRSPVQPTRSPDRSFEDDGDNNLPPIGRSQDGRRSPPDSDFDTDVGVGLSGRSNRRSTRRAPREQRNNPLRNSLASTEREKWGRREQREAAGINAIEPPPRAEPPTLSSRSGGLSREDRIEAELGRIRQEKQDNAARRGVKRLAVPSASDRSRRAVAAAAGQPPSKAASIDTTELENSLAAAASPSVRGSPPSPGGKGKLKPKSPKASRARTVSPGAGTLSNWRSPRSARVSEGGSKKPKGGASGRRSAPGGKRQERAASVDSSNRRGEPQLMNRSMPLGNVGPNSIRPAGVLAQAWAGNANESPGTLPTLGMKRPAAKPSSRSKPARAEPGRGVFPPVPSAENTRSKNAHNLSQGPENG
jgi:hypothetical protein